MEEIDSHVKPKPGGKYKCPICGLEYSQALYAQECYTNHDPIVVIFSREELIGLVNFLYTKEEKFIPQRAVKMLIKLAKKPRKSA